METIETRLAELEARMQALVVPPNDYYQSSFANGEAVDAALRRAQSGGEIDTLVAKKSDADKVVNPNLLDNWYFGNLVNQRGLTEYTAVGYTIDRWKLPALHKVNVLSTGIKITCSATASLKKAFAQIVPIIKAGQIYTMSALIVENTTTAGINLRHGDAAGQSINYDGIISYTFVATKADETSDISIQFTDKASDDGNYVVLLAMKLELGDQQTLAHQDADGNWVLNEIPDYGEQLARCQRYFKCYKAGTVLPCVAFSEQDGWYLDAALPIIGLRTSPANNIGAAGVACSVRDINASADWISKTIANWGYYSGVQMFRLTGTQNTSNVWPYIIRMDADLTFSADL